MKREVPLAITFITGILLVVAFFIPHPPLGDLQQRFQIWYSIVVGFTFLLGLNSLVGHHFKKIQHKRSGWGYSIALLISFFTTLILGFYSWIVFSSPYDLRSPFQWLYTSAILPLQATMFALLAFFIASAAYRAFRARNLAATLLLVSAGIVMLGRVPIGKMIWSGLPVISDWVMNYPQMAAKRGILMGTYLGAIAMSLRIILGMERTYLT
ncbi:MAG TPA: hypothetical protein EYP58_05085 [bacterium (Candidatus Stahlbacteria)]|nr:hypothetical protein [Candidatus Stahlbacteria bacterium]